MTTGSFFKNLGILLLLAISAIAGATVVELLIYYNGADRPPATVPAADLVDSSAPPS